MPTNPAPLATSQTPRAEDGEVAETARGVAGGASPIARATSPASALTAAVAT